MKIIVTGGCGFIGSHFIDLIIDNYNVLNIDKMTYASSNYTNEKYKNYSNYKFINKDINDSSLSNFIDSGDIIVNFAAESHVDNSIKNPNVFIQTNVNGVQNLLNCSRNKVKLFIQISTDEVYGSLNVDSPSSKENDILCPSSPYSASKCAAEMLCIAEHKTFNTPIIITRSSNNYGPRQNKEKLIPLFIDNLMKNKSVPVYGNGNNIRNWIHVNDNCLAIKKIIENGNIGEIYNIGGDIEIKNIDLTRFLLDYFSKDDSYLNFVTDRLGHDFRYSLNSDKIKQLGWKCYIDFKNGIKDTIKWYENNKNWR